MNDYYKYRLIGYMKGKGVYEPTDSVGQRGLAIEERGPGSMRYLRGMTEKEKLDWVVLLSDCARMQRLAQERRILISEQNEL